MYCITVEKYKNYLT
ncbi:hypothetical protein [Myroides sp. N17-2]